MIAGWSPLQLPLGTDCPGKGTFTPAPPPTPSRFLSREHSLFPCGSYCDRGGSDSFSFPDLKASLVGNLIGALINATEILDEYADCPDQSHVFEQLLELEASHKERDLVLSSDSLAHSESLGLVPLERLSDGDHNDSAVSPSFHQIVAMPYWSQRHAHTDNTVRPSTVLNVDGLSKGQRKLSVDTTKRSAKDEHGTAHNSISEEDLLLQQARSKAHRSKAKIGVVNTNSSQAGTSAVRSRDGSARGPQHLVRVYSLVNGVPEYLNLSNYVVSENSV